MAESDEHFKPLRLFDLARHSRFEITDEEREHLSECAECRSVLEVAEFYCFGNFVSN